MLKMSQMRRRPIQNNFQFIHACKRVKKIYVVETYDAKGRRVEVDDSLIIHRHSRIKKNSSLNESVVSSLYATICIALVKMLNNFNQKY